MINQRWGDGWTITIKLVGARCKETALMPQACLSTIKRASARPPSLRPEMLGVARRDEEISDLTECASGKPGAKMFLARVRVSAQISAGGSLQRSAWLQLGSLCATSNIRQPICARSPAGTVGLCLAPLAKTLPANIAQRYHIEGRAFFAMVYVVELTLHFERVEFGLCLFPSVPGCTFGLQQELRLQIA